MTEIKRALLIVSHGSRLQKANQEMQALTESIRNTPELSFDLVEGAFLEFGEPTVEEQIAGLAEQQVKEIVVFPLFLAEGRHVSVDLPEMLREAESANPHIHFIQSVHLGGINSLKDMILSEVTQKGKAV